MFEAQNYGPPQYAKAKFLDLLFSASESLGMESRDLLRRAGLNSVSRRGPPGLVPFGQAVALYDAATQTLGDTGLIPNMVARLPKASDLCVPGFTLLTAPSLARVVDCLPSVYHSQTRRGSWEPRLEGANCILAWKDPHLTQGLAACNEANVLHLVTVMLRDICGEAVPVQSGQLQARSAGHQRRPTFSVPRHVRRRRNGRSAAARRSRHGPPSCPRRNAPVFLHDPRRTARAGLASAVNGAGSGVW